jgi:hypothetical protein
MVNDWCNSDLQFEVHGLVSAVEIQFSSSSMVFLGSGMVWQLDLPKEVSKTSSS